MESISKPRSNLFNAFIHDNELSLTFIFNSFEITRMLSSLINETKVFAKTMLIELNEKMVDHITENCFYPLMKHCIIYSKGAYSSHNSSISCQTYLLL